MNSKSIRRTQRRVRPKGWNNRVKSYANSLMEQVFGKKLFRLSIYDLFGPPPDWQRNLTRRWRSLVKDTNLPYAFALLGICIAILIAWHAFAPRLFPDAWVEIIGLTYDVLFILIFFAFFEHRRQQALDMRRQQEIIDDYKKWDSDEAKFRIAGAIRRLIRMGKTDIDFGGLELRTFSFRQHDIKSLRGSLFYDGTWGEAGSRDQVVLQDVDFSRLNCRDVTFSIFNPFGDLQIDVVFASVVDCSFVCSDLEGAAFNGALLEWTKEPPEETGEWVELDNGPPAFHQIYYPPFHQANLAGASFQHAQFKNADFREAEGVLECNFSGANGLETCLFDDEETKGAVLAMAGDAGRGLQEVEH